MALSYYHQCIREVGEFEEMALSDIEGAPFFVPERIRTMQAYIAKIGAFQAEQRELERRGKADAQREKDAAWKAAGEAAVQRVEALNKETE